MATIPQHFGVPIYPARALLRILCIVCLSACIATAARPNVIIILADDMGFSDLGCYGGEINTPHIDRLAANGLRFTNFYNAGRCCPTRASLLTGLYPHQTGVGNMTHDDGTPGYRGFLNNQCVTLAEVLGSSGYLTAMTGKWHVGGEDFVASTPWKRGFERSLSAKAGGFYHGFPKDGAIKMTQLWLNGQNLSSDAPELPENWYSTDLFTDYGIKFIDEAVSEDKPFFLYLAHTAPHFPLQAPEEDIARYRGRYMAGWDKLRERRYKRQTELGVIDASWPLSPLPNHVSRIPDVPAWYALDDEQKRKSDLIMALYAACVDRMDQSVGRLVKALEQRKVLDNTLIMILSDNGGEKGGGVLGKLNLNKGGRMSAFCGQAWATLQNTPFRLYKSSQHEGGISTPLIAHWPEKITKGGAICRERGHVVDIMATCVEMAGAKYPEEHNGNRVLPMEGRSLVPAFSGGKLGGRTIFWEHAGNSAMLDGDWKLVSFGKTGAWELYNIAGDRTELKDLARCDPARVKDLETRWKAWAARTGALPKPAKNRVKNR